MNKKQLDKLKEISNTLEPKLTKLLNDIDIEPTSISISYDDDLFFGYAQCELKIKFRLIR